VAPAASPERVLFDTNIAIFLAQGREFGQRYRPHVEGKIPALSFASAAKLLLTARRAGKPDQALEYWRTHLPYYVVLFPDLQMCSLWSQIVATLRLKGISRQDNDLWVAATALRYDLPLITHNPKHFSDIAGLNVITEP